MTNSKCAQCKKEYKCNIIAKGCPKCAPGISIAESEFIKPIEKFMKFKQENILGKISFFTDKDPPKWLSSEDTVKGSTMDNRWFWKDHVLTLAIGDFVRTDFSKITRIA
jgi:hypothetical protein